MTWGNERAVEIPVTPGTVQKARIYREQGRWEVLFSIGMPGPWYFMAQQRADAQNAKLGVNHVNER